MGTPDELTKPSASRYTTLYGVILATLSSCRGLHAARPHVLYRLEKEMIIDAVAPSELQQSELLQSTSSYNIPIPAKRRALQRNNVSSIKATRARLRDGSARAVRARPGYLFERSTYNGKKIAPE
jgi:hypothetical protein